MKLLICLALATAVAAHINEEIPGEYLVVMKKGYKLNAISHLYQGSQVFYESASFTHFRNMSPEMAARLERSPLVESIEINRMVHLDDPVMPEDDQVDVQQWLDYKRAPSTDATCTHVPQVNDMWNWQIIRTSHRGLPLWAVQDFLHDGLGSGAFVYVLDTGIHLGHIEFQGRAVHVFTAPEHEDEAPGDNHGHGTHVAGLAGGHLCGAAKEAILGDVKVLGAAGSGSFAAITAGIDAARVHAEGRGNYHRGVINMSLGGGGSSPAMRTAVNNAIDARVMVVVSAGNGNTDASNQIPAGWPECIAVGASDREDRWATFTNFGPLVDITAGGVATMSAWINNHVQCAGQPTDGCYRSISGTSMSAPVTAGTIARHLGNLDNFNFFQQTQETIRSWLIDNATMDALEITQSGQATTVNRLLFYLDCEILG